MIKIYLVIFCLFFTQISYAAPQRVALIIGNADYSSSMSPLKNPVNDAKAMSKVLTKMGFKIISGTNLSRKQMNTKIREFGKAIEKAEVALFYYAGHAVQSDGENFLIPLSANIEMEDEIRGESISANRVLKKMGLGSTNVNIVILDACRNNPFKSAFRSASRGLVRITGPKGSLIAYATKPGGVAADGDGDNGLYTKSLIKHIQEPIPLEQVFKKVRNDVIAQTGNRQVPWENSSLIGDDFYFNVNVTINQHINTGTSHKTGKLTINSNVNNDIVIINGKRKGSSELNLDLKPGVYFIEISKKGYMTFEQSYTVTAGTEQVLYAKLKKRGTIIQKEFSPKVEEKEYTYEQQQAIDLFNKM